MNNKLFVVFLIMIVVILWAGNFIAVAYVVKEIEPFTALTLRFCFVSILLSPYLFKKILRIDFLFLILATLILVPGHFGLLFLAIAMTKSLGGISVLIQLSIPFSILFAWFFYKDKPSLLRTIGLVISFTGIVFLLYDPSLLESQSSFIVAILSALCLGLYFVVVKRIKNIPAMSIIAWSSFLGIPIMYCFMLFFNQNFEVVFNLQNTHTIPAFLYVVVGSSILGHGLWAYLLKTQDISFISPFLLLVPLVAVILSAIVFKEEINEQFIITSSIIMIGIFIVFISKNTPKIKDKNEYIK